MNPALSPMNRDLQSIRLSVVVITWNRKSVLLENLRQIYGQIGLPAEAWELLVVDNASTDGSADAVAEAFPAACLIRLPENRGMPARNEALRQARGQYILLLLE